VGISNPSVIFSTTRLSSFTVGPAGAKGAFMYALYDTLIIEKLEDNNNNMQKVDKTNNLPKFFFTNDIRLFFDIL
jgi:hypothetical protein